MAVRTSQAITPPPPPFPEIQGQRVLDREGGRYNPCLMNIRIIIHSDFARLRLMDVFSMLLDNELILFTERIKNKQQRGGRPSWLSDWLTDCPWGGGLG